MTPQASSVSLQPVRDDESEELVRVRIEAMRDSLERIGRFDATRARRRFLDGFVPELTRHILLEHTRVGFMAVRPSAEELSLSKPEDEAYSIVLADGVPVGAFSSSRSEQDVTLLELLVLPAHQNRGIGTRVVQQLQQEARDKRVPLLLQVLHLNRARQLYERLGFRVFETTETHYRMRWEAAPANG
jgi:ribosomal protein S18 acetylase RimI-like enzyme